MAEVAVAKAPAKAAETKATIPWFRPIFPFPKGIFTQNPFELMREFTKEMDRFFEPMDAAGKEAVWYPALECKRANGDLVVKAEVPGLKPEEITVEVTDDALIIKGERKHEEKEEKEGYYRSERSYGKFYREVALPEGAKAAEAKAEMSNGVLEVKVPVTEVKPKARQVPVDSKA